jgi:hypothetical protein
MGKNALEYQRLMLRDSCTAFHVDMLLLVASLLARVLCLLLCGLWSTQIPPCKRRRLIDHCEALNWGSKPPKQKRGGKRPLKSKICPYRVLKSPRSLRVSE